MYYGPERKNQRLKSYDYSQAGYYFVTFCTKGRINYFGEVVEGEMILNEYGENIDKNIKDTPNHFLECMIDCFIIMPNHIHIITIIRDVGNADLRFLHEDWQQRTKMTLSKIIHGIKSSTTREIRQKYRDYDFAWQKSFHDVIIRNENQLEKTREYIRMNPRRWGKDVNNVCGITKKEEKC